MRGPEAGDCCNKLRMGEPTVDDRRPRLGDPVDVAHVRACDATRAYKSSQRPR